MWLPARLHHTRKKSLMGHLTKADTADAKLTVIGFGATTQVAPIVQADFRVLAFFDKFTPLLLFNGHRCFSQGGTPLIQGS